MRGSDIFASLNDALDRDGDSSLPILPLRPSRASRSARPALRVCRHEDRNSRLHYWKIVNFPMNQICASFILLGVKSPARELRQSS